MNAASAAPINLPRLGTRNDALIRLLRNGQAHTHRDVKKEQRKLSNMLNGQAGALARDHFRAFNMGEELAHVLVIGERLPCDTRVHRHTGARIHEESISVAFNCDRREGLGAAIAEYNAQQAKRRDFGSRLCRRRIASAFVHEKHASAAARQGSHR